MLESAALPAEPVLALPVSVLQPLCHAGYPCGAKDL